MPTRGRPAELLVDTSVAVALVVADHEHHATTLKAIGRRRLGLAGHAAFETFSVLTRLPPPARRTPATVAEVLAANFPATRYLSERSTARLFERVAAAGIAGGSVYDAFVGATAAQHGMVLATRDRRALETYRALGVEVEVLGA
jgi:predicted nucleic acid-binding protein